MADLNDLKRYGSDLWRVVSHPAWFITVALSGVGLYATSRAAVAERWPTGRLVFVGALGAGVAFGVIAPLFPPLGRSVATAATVAQAAAAPQPRSRSAVNKSFEPAQGVESAGVFPGQ